MDDDAEQLTALLARKLGPADEDALTTKLERRPELRRTLADLALKAEGEKNSATVHLLPAAELPDRRGAEGVDVGATLGQGGMAVVRLGQQLKLDRPVAVKTLREDRRSPEDIERLLREARITGRLEHPNIVPVHDIVTGPDGVPQVVLKRIEGNTWSELMRDEARVRELFGAHDLLEWNLGVLMAVARALSFAHSHRVIHRDVKPANVMLGNFGEVYLLDWGIAFELDQPGGDSGASELAGTTGYMAPEQVLGSTAPLGTWTDTYLLGATLFHLLTGRPPHAGIPMEVRIADLLENPIRPQLPEDVPTELRRIAERALEQDVARRTKTPEDLRLALADFLQHRGATRLADHGDRERARAALAVANADDPEWERAVLAADLAYRAALEEWSDCDAARYGARQLTALRVEHALTHGEPQLAARILQAQTELPPELQARVEAAVAQAAEEAERLQRMVIDADRGFGHRMRGLFGGVFGLIWVTFWCWMAFAPPADVTALIAFPLAVAVVGGALISVFAPQLFRNRINRTSMSVVASGLPPGVRIVAA